MNDFVPIDFFFLFHGFFTAEVRSTKTKLSSTVAEMLQEREVAESEASTQRELSKKIGEEVAVLRQEKELELKSNAELKHQLEVC